jgi:hypothetical protein
MVKFSEWSLEDTNLLMNSIETLGNETKIWKLLSILFKKSVTACKRKYRKIKMKSVSKTVAKTARKTARKAVRIPSKGKEGKSISENELFNLELECFEVIFSDPVNAHKTEHIPSKGKEVEPISDEELFNLELECFEVIFSDRKKDEYDIFMRNTPVDIFDINTFHFTPN